MKKLTLLLIITASFIAGISLVYHLKTQEEKKGSTTSPALKALTGAGLACAVIGSRLPYGTPAAITFMRRYLLTTFAAQTTAGTALSLSETLKKETAPFTKASADIGYGLHNLVFVEIARRLPYNSPARALFLRRYTTFCLASQALGIAGKELVGPFCNIAKGLVDFTQPQQLEEIAECLPFE